MKTEQVFNEIVSEPKWYANLPNGKGGFMSAQLASMFKRNFKRGTLKQSTINRFFAKFGYEQNEVTWTKKS